MNKLDESMVVGRVYWRPDARSMRLSMWLYAGGGLGKIGVVHGLGNVWAATGDGTTCMRQAKI